MRRCSKRGGTFMRANSSRRSSRAWRPAAPGVNAAVKAQVVYATYLEKSDKAKLELMEEAANLADERRQAAPKDANAHYLYAFALGRYSQGISVAKALAQGFGGKIKDALLTALKLDAQARRRAYRVWRLSGGGDRQGRRHRRRHDLRREEGLGASSTTRRRSSSSRSRRSRASSTATASSTSSARRRSRRRPSCTSRPPR